MAFAGSIPMTFCGKEGFYEYKPKGYVKRKDQFCYAVKQGKNFYVIFPDGVKRKVSNRSIKPYDLKPVISPKHHIENLEELIRNSRETINFMEKMLESHTPEEMINVL